MNIFRFAMQMEKDGENFYRELAKKSINTGIRQILTLLAEEEVRHFQVLSQMEHGSPELPDTTVLNDVKNVFAQMQTDGNTLDLQTDQVDLYRQAQDLEKKSQDFYTEKAQEVETPAQKRLLEKIAAEEERHYFLLDNIIELVSRPETWLENAEWRHLDKY
ncbi:MAG: ferritin family protein [Sedimentisphaerales bacterium]|nr:ferritin family protein [Sedimentisphaerales bacterium]